MSLKALCGHAEGLEERGQWSEAASVWKELIAADSDLRFFVRAALALSKANQLDEAAQILENARHLYGHMPRFLVTFARVEEKRGNLDSARAALEAALRAEEEPFLWTILGSIQSRLGDLVAAEHSYSRALQLDPRDDEAHLGLARILAKRDRNAAIDHFRQAIDAAPQDGHVYRELAQLLWRAGRAREAEEAARRAIELDPLDAWAHDILGHLAIGQDDWMAALREFRLAVDVDPGVAMFWCDLADATFRVGVQDEADRYFLKALSIAVDDGYCHLHYGVFLKNIGRLDKARTYLRRAINLDPSLERAKRVLSELEDIQT